MLARFSRLIPMYQGIGTPRRRRAALRTRASQARSPLLMALVVGLLRAGSVPTEDGKLAI